MESRNTQVSSTGNSRGRHLLWGALLFGAVLAAYANSFGNAFHFDDFHTITDNSAVRRLGNVPRFFTDASTFSVLPANRTYRPFVSTSLALDYALGQGYAPFWFHLSTFVWFVLLIALLYLLYEAVLDRTEQEGRRPSARHASLALLTAAWFGLHPAMAETVNYVIQRGDLYCTLGCVAALVVFARFPRGRRTGVYLLPFAFALLSKPPAAVFPVLLFCFVFFFEAENFEEKGRTTAKRRIGVEGVPAPARGSSRWKKSLMATSPALVVTVLGLWLQAMLTPKTFAPSILSPTAYRLTQPFVWLRYFCAMFLPVHLNVDSDLQPFATIHGRAFAGFGFVLLLLAAIVWATRQRRSYPIAFGMIWFVATQLPTSIYPLSEVENDHRMFFSFPGLMLATLWAGWLAFRWLLSAWEPARVRAWRPVLLGCALVMLSGYAWGVHVRNRVWATEESLWLDDVKKSPGNGRGLMIYGLTQMNKGAYPVALDLFERALQFTPNYSTLEINLGVVNGAMGRSAEAERHFLRAIALMPGDDQGYAFYGRWLLEQGRFPEALAQERTAVAMNPARATQRDVLLQALQSAGDAAGLRQEATETLAAIPGEALAEAMLRQQDGRAAVSASDLVNVSLAQYREGQFAASIETARKALRIDPRLAEAYNNIGAAFGAMGHWDEAIANETRAVELNPNLQIAKNNLRAFSRNKAMDKPVSPVDVQVSAAEWVNRSLALNQAGKYAESIRAAQAALKLDAASAEAWNNIAANYEAMKQWDEAIAAARKALALKPDFHLARNNLEWSTTQKKAGSR